MLGIMQKLDEHRRILRCTQNDNPGCHSEPSTERGEESPGILRCTQNDRGRSHREFFA